MSRVTMHPLYSLAVRPAVVILSALLLAMFAVIGSTRLAQAAGVVGTGTPGSCTAATFAAAVAGGGNVSFNCGSLPHAFIVNTTLVTNDLTINGGGTITLDGENLRQHFHVLGGGDLELENITLTRGNSAQGGAIFVETNGEAELVNVTVQLSHAEGASGSGGAIYSKGELELLDSQILSNTADLRGGGLFNAGGTVRISRTAFHNNGAFDHSPAQVGMGGAIYQLSGTMAIVRSSISANAAERRGGGIVLQAGSLSLLRVNIIENSSNGVANTDGGGLYVQNGTVQIQSSTLARNRADTGGGVYNVGGTVTLKNVIVADNTVLLSSNPDSVLDCDGPTLFSSGYNIIGDSSCLTGPAASDRKNTLPLLEPTAQVGALRFAAPMATSPALNSGSNDPSCAEPDVRGARPIGVCDVGAIEYARFAWLPAARK